MQAQLGAVQTAVSMHIKALDLVRSEMDSEHPNEESLYTADAYAGLAETESILATRSEPGTIEQCEHGGKACDWNEQRLKMWHRIREPGALSPHGFYCISPSTVSRHLAECKSELARFEATPEHAARRLMH
jgi:hypothetical protein